MARPVAAINNAVLVMAAEERAVDAHLRRVRVARHAEVACQGSAEQ